MMYVAMCPSEGWELIEVHYPIHALVKLPKMLAFKRKSGKNVYLV